MKYKIGQKVYYFDKKCIIIATKEIPYSPVIHPLNKKEIFPSNDYILAIFKEYKDNKEIYLGNIDVFEHQITNKEW